MHNFNTYGYSKRDYDKIQPLVKNDIITLNILLTIFMTLISSFLLKSILDGQHSPNRFLAISAFILAVIAIILRIVTKCKANTIVDASFDIILALATLVTQQFYSARFPFLIICFFLIFSQFIRVKKFLHSIVNEVIIFSFIYYILLNYRGLRIPFEAICFMIAISIFSLIINYYFITYKISIFMHRYEVQVDGEQHLVLANEISNKFIAFAEATDTVFLEYNLDNQTIICNDSFEKNYKVLIGEGTTLTEKILSVESLDQENKNKILKLFAQADQRIETEIEIQTFQKISSYFIIKSLFFEHLNNTCLVLIKDVSREYQAKKDYEALIHYQNFQLGSSFANIIFNVSKNTLINATGDKNYLEFIKDNSSQQMTAKLIESMPVEADRIKYLEYLGREQLIKHFERGDTKFTDTFKTKINGNYHLLKVDNILTINPNTQDIVSISTVNDITIVHQMETLFDGIINYGYDYTAIIDLSAKVTTIYKPKNITNKITTDLFFSNLIINAKFNALKDITNITDTLEILNNSNYVNYIFDTKDNQTKQLIIFKANDNELGILQSDITLANEHEKNNLKELHKALNSANTANIAKSVFLSRMSHDIRTPLNAIIGLTEIAMNEIENNNKFDAYENHKLIIENSKHLLELINDILEMSSMESNKLALNEEIFDLNKNISALVDRLSPLTLHKRIQVKTTINIEDNVVKTDKLKINRIIENLLNNAIKYSKVNSIIELTCNELTKSNNIANYEFIVKDYGKGITVLNKQDIFEPFVTGETDNNNGTGLGLTIVKQLVDTLGGTITVESEINVGSSFTFILPLTIATSNLIEINSNQNSSFEKLTILVVEDNSTNSMILTKILKNKGISVITAFNGEEGVNTFKEKQSEIDLILMDISMPILNGLEASKTIRTFNKEVPIIALSANAFLEDRKKSLNAGMNYHISKPINQDILFEAITIFSKSYLKPDFKQG